MALTNIRAPLRCVPPPNRAGLTLLAGRLEGAGTSAPTVTATRNPPGLTVSRTSEGIYVLTLPGKGGLDIVSATFTVESADRDLLAAITEETATSRTIEVTVFDTDESAGSAVVEDIDAGEGLHYCILIAD